MRSLAVVLSLAMAGVFAWAGSASAETIMVPEEGPAGLASVPTKGMSMGNVVSRFGEPLVRHPAVGGGAPLQPPITRWDYRGFSVFFERQTVVDAVVEGAPAEVHRMDQLVSQ